MVAVGTRISPRPRAASGYLHGRVDVEIIVERARAKHVRFERAIDAHCRSAQCWGRVTPMVSMLDHLVADIGRDHAMRDHVRNTAQTCANVRIYTSFDRAKTSSLSGTSMARVVYPFKLSEAYCPGTAMSSMSAALPPS